MHKILRRQLKRLNLSHESRPSNDREWVEFLGMLDESYDQWDQVQYRLERSLEISSEEMVTLHENLRTHMLEELDKTRAVLSSVGAGLCVFDADGTIQSVNPETENLLGIAADELIGNCIADFLDTSTISGGCSAIKELLRNDRSISNYSSRMIRADGGAFPVTISINPIAISGESSSAILAFFDMTDLHNAEQELNESVALLHSTLESTADGILVVNEDGAIATYNQQFAHMWRMPEEVLAAGDDKAAIGHVLSQLVDPREFLDEVERLYMSAETSTDILHFRDGRVFERFSKPLSAVDGSGGRVWSFRDITEKVQAATARDKYAAELERLVEDLQEARDHAEKSAKLKSAILNNMSHEIRTPMTAIIGFAQVLAEELDDSHSEFIDYITSNGERLLQTVNGILDFSKLESNQFQLDLRTQNLCELTRQHLALIGPIAKNKGLALTVNCHSDPRALVDETSFGRILFNIVGNAVKFTEEGEIVVTIDEDEAGPFVSVSDTGKGIAPEFLPQVFEEFSQESDGLSRSHEGNGLGLAITRRLVDAHGGKIAVASVPERGSTFTVHFARPTFRLIKPTVIADASKATGTFGS